MENLKILAFISRDCGNGGGYGEGSGSSYCDGSGSGIDDSSEYINGEGHGDGCGSGQGSCISYGYGRGYGCGVTYNSCVLDSGTGFYTSGSSLNSINGKKVYIVDGLVTTISHIHGNTAKGTIVNTDLTETPCYIVKEGKYFAHGKTLAEANASLQNKLFVGMSAEERIAAFWKCHEKGVKYSTKDFFEWHHKLTGSCLMGRQQFAKYHDVNLEGEMTVEEFVTLTKDSFGGDIIRKLEEGV